MIVTGVEHKKRISVLQLYEMSTRVNFNISRLLVESYKTTIISLHVLYNTLLKKLISIKV